MKTRIYREYCDTALRKTPDEPCPLGPRRCIYEGEHGCTWYQGHGVDHYYPMNGERTTESAEGAGETPAVEKEQQS